MDVLKYQNQTSQCVTVQAPGRINIIGEHTDYNSGFVLPAAIDKKTQMHISLNGTSSKVNAVATNINESFSFDLLSFSPIHEGWPNYIMGVVHELQKLGADIRGFDAEFGGDVPIGSGMSSSAALECSLAFALNELFGLGLSAWQMIKAAQMAEHHFVGTKCGIMDQFASMMGKKDHVMLLDCQSLEFDYYPFSLGQYQLLLLNTNVYHSLASSEYNTRRSECEEGVYLLKKEHPAITSLRDVSMQQLLDFQARLPEHIFRRCRHVISENQRVKDAAEVMQGADCIRLGKLMNQSHFSLKNDYNVSCPELDFLAEQAISKDYVLGSRMMGGGFGGCTINIVRKAQTEELVDHLSHGYRDRFGIDLTPYFVTIENGLLEGGIYSAKSI